MPELMSIEKKGFFATPPGALHHICRILRPPHANSPVRLLEPCAGEGVAAAAVRTSLRADNPNQRVEVYACELDQVRAARAAENLGNKQTTVQCAGFEQMHITAQAFNLCYLNPPYQEEFAEPKERQEFTFLKRAFPKLQPGAVLVYIVKREFLDTYEIRDWIADRFEYISVWRFDDGEYEAFTQVVMFARVRAKPERYAYFGGNWSNPAPISTANLAIAIPEATDIKHAITFKAQLMFNDELMAHVLTKGVQTTARWHNFIEPPAQNLFTPLTPLKAGHLIHLISSGAMGTTRMGAMGLMRGNTLRMQTFKDADGNLVPKDKITDDNIASLTSTTSFSVAVHILSPDGAHRTISGDKMDELKEMLIANGPAIEAVLMRDYAPLYAEATPAEWAKIDKVLKKKLLPGRHKAGLLTPQKHAVIAISRALKKYGFGSFACEPGCGKTPMGASTAYMLDAFPTLVMAPGHMTTDWQREWENTIPNGRAVIVKTITQLDRAIASYKPGEAFAVIMSKEQAKLGSRYSNACHHGATENHHRAAIFGPAVQKLPNPPKPVAALPVHPTTRALVQASYKTVPPAKTLHVNEEGKRYLGRCCPKCGAPMPERYDDSNKPMTCEARYWTYPSQPANHQPAATPDDGAPILDVHGNPIRDGNGQPVTAAAWVRTSQSPNGDPVLSDTGVVCGEPLYQWGGLQRWPLATYIKAKHKHFFQLFIADEAHEFKGRTTDQGGAYHLLTCCTKYTLNLTGTPFGGPASDLFALCYRTNPEVRAHYTWDDADKWVETYGRCKTTYRGSASNRSSKERELDAKYGNFTGTMRDENIAKVQELPGIHAGIYRWTLPNMVLMQLSDLGIRMPDYTESIVRIPMTDTQRAQYGWFSSELLDYLTSCLQSRDKDTRRRGMALMSRWLTDSLYRPNSGYRTELVQWKDPDCGGADVPYFTDECAADYGYTAADDDDEGGPHPYETGHHLDIRGAWPNFEDPEDASRAMVLYPVVKPDELLPKEAWLLKTCLAEKREDRKVLLYVSQTSTRDIRPRLQKILVSKGLRAVVMPEMAPAKRADWIMKNQGNTDVLILNPNCVKTGLNLIWYPTLIMLEAQTSLFTVIQAARRSYRPTQVKPVKVFFPVYENSMEEHILRLIRKKARALETLFGRKAAGDLAFDEDESSLIKALFEAAVARQGQEAVVETSDDTDDAPAIGAIFVAAPDQEYEDTVDANFDDALTTETDATGDDAGTDDDAPPPAPAATDEIRISPFILDWNDLRIQEQAAIALKKAAKKPRVTAVATAGQVAFCDGAGTLVIVEQAALFAM